MKKVFVMLMAIGFFISSCNNNKNGKNINNREKDDYGKNDNPNTGDEKTGNTGWSEKEKSSSLKECIESFADNQEALANKICPCVVGKLEKEYASYNDADKKGGEAAVERIALQCKEEIVGNDNINNTGYKWSKSDEDEWMKVCATSFDGGLGEETTNSYCSCVLEKLEKMYSSYYEMNTKGTHAIGVELGEKCRKELGLGQ